MDNLCTLLIAKGDLEEPEDLLREYIAGRDQHMGGAASIAYPTSASSYASTDLLTLTACHELGTLLYEKKQLVAAEGLFQRVAGGRRAVLGSSHLETLSALNNLGIVVKGCI